MERQCTIVARFVRSQRYLNRTINDLPERSQELGDLGEDLAAAYLRKERVNVLYRNYAPPKGGEVDIVARERDILLFCEVKTRRRETLRGRPMEAVDRRKQELIERGGRAYLKLLNRAVPIRYDIIEVILAEGEIPDIKHVKNVF